MKELSIGVLAVQGDVSEPKTNQNCEKLVMISFVETFG